MAKATFVLAAAIFTVVAGPSQAQLTEATLDSPSLGKLLIRSHHTGTDPLFLTVELPDGKVIKRVDFNIGGVGEGRVTNLRFCVLPLTKPSEPLMVAVAGEPGGSNSGFEMAVLGITDGAVSDLIQPHVRANIADPLFVCTLPPKDNGATVRVVALRRIEEQTPTVSAPQRYASRVFTWNGKKLTEVEEHETEKAYPNWPEATKELGCDDCHINLVQAMLPELM